MRRLILAAMVGALAACGRAPGAPVYVPEPSRADLTVTNGSNLNGSNLNGSNLNGSNLNGPSLGSMLVSVRYAGAKRGCADVTGLHLEGTTLVGNIGGDTKRGAELVGMTLVGNVGDGSTVALTVADATHPASPNADLDLYSVTFTASDGTQQPLCVDRSTGDALYATAVANRWNYAQGVSGGGALIVDDTAFTFACDKAAIFKCVMWGYRPWASVNGVSLQPYHQACTRLVRADYCGDGTSHTTDGSWINVYDDQGVQLDTEDWVMEAQWSPDGATCVNPLGVADGGADLPCPQVLNPLCAPDDPDAMETTETPHGYRSPQQ